MAESPNRREVLALGVGLSLSGLSLAAPNNPLPPNVREVRVIANPQDKGRYVEFPDEPGDDFWVLDFRFKDPRLIYTDVPARGKKVCWYLWYQVINKTNKPRTIPSMVLDLVTRDRQTRHRDQYLPTVQEEIRKLEDPRNYYKIKNSFSISSEPIPISKKDDAVLKTVTGVAIWDDVDPDTNYFSIFVMGLSNGFTITDAKPKDIIRKKTLQLNFTRTGDRYEMKSSEIKYESPEMWVYRATT